MSRWAALFIAAVVWGLPVSQPLSSQAASSTTEGELTALLTQFLNDAGTNNPAGFDRFFADDLIYTRSAGAITTKADIMRSLNSPRNESASATAKPKSTFSAEDITIHPYSDTAIVAFRLVGRTEFPDGKVEIANYRNTGTFLRRNGKWQVVAWQSTKMPDAPGNASATSTNASEISAIATLWAREWTARHPETVLSLYADDAVFHAPDQGTIAGRAAIKGLFLQMQSTVIPSLAMHSTRSQIAGNLAYDSGDFQETVTMKADNSTQRHHGTYLMVLRREAGKWLIIEHMWSDLTALPAAQ
jgi:uncharacterized protein (TIGR02246 family)